MQSDSVMARVKIGQCGKEVAPLVHAASARQERGWQNGRNAHEAEAEADCGMTSFSEPPSLSFQPATLDAGASSPFHGFISGRPCRAQTDSALSPTRK